METNSPSQSRIWIHRNLEFTGFPHPEQEAVLESYFQDEIEESWDLLGC